MRITFAVTPQYHLTNQALLRLYNANAKGFKNRRLSPPHLAYKQSH
ncbi:hypothetical protein QWZ16_01925 [Vibrio ostreicida]|uniref:Uncharacterized protein n=1 Tax=Vibrio ostreicida TaxID=526588 RepID=A0ABT8BNT5_9VIBR|nr:hypothetical protein [Vibrio ostreicida]MDN3608536.1 hypothetical protein [Vibrio ostreicida]